MSKKFYTAAIPTILLLCTALNSCGDTEVQVPVTTEENTEAAAAEETVSENVRASVNDNLPDDLDFGGKEIRLFIRPECEKFDAVGENSGDIVYDAVYQRNLAIENRLNIKLKVLESGETFDEMARSVKQAITAGDDVYDIIMQRGPQCFQQSVSHYYLNLKDCDYIDISQPWWWMDINYACSVNSDYLYFMTGDISLSTFLFSTACFFNKTMMESLDYSVDELYQTVADGKWTYDVFESYLKNIYKDLDGDNKPSDNDRYGFSWLGYNTNYFTYSAGLKYSEHDSDGYPVLTVNNERTAAYVEKIVHILHDNNYAYLVPTKDYQILASYFTSGRNLFLMSRFIWTTDVYNTNLRSMTDPYGIIPYPKFDETCDYMSGTGTSGNFVAIPTTCTSVDATSATIEAMCAENYRTVFPAMYETAMKVKYSDDNIDSQMIDIIHDHIFIDFTAISEMDILVHSLAEKGSSDFVSAYTKKESSLLKTIEKFKTAYES